VVVLNLDFFWYGGDLLLFGFGWGWGWTVSSPRGNPGGGVLRKCLFQKKR
jgi:hypothetical protein